jgi:hypothetical protein
MAIQTPPGRGSGRPAEGYTAIVSKTFRKGREILYWPQRLRPRQSYTVTHKTTERKLCKGCPYDNELGAGF